MSEHQYYYLAEITVDGVEIDLDGTVTATPAGALGEAKEQTVSRCETLPDSVLITKLNRL